MKKMKRWLAFMVLLGLMGISTGCSHGPALTRYDAQFLQLFDTVTSVVGYSKDKESFTAYVEELREELQMYHQLYDIYHDYEGVNNLKTINDNAGIQPVVVDEKIIELLEFSKEMNQQTDGYVNVAMGSVLSIWHDYRSEGIDNPQEADLPSMEALEEANQFTGIEAMVIDRDASTVYLPEASMSLDVGAIAKGYATEQACRKLEADGFSHALVSVGGNVRAIGTKDGGDPWKVGIQNPDTESDTKYLHSVQLTDMSLVTSGTYQRYYTVEGKEYHHIINPDTLMPWNRYESVSILCPDSGMADALSTAVFNMEPEQGEDLIESLEWVEAMWLYPDGSEVYSSGFQEYLES